MSNTAPKTLRELLDEASAAIDTYKHPDTSEFEAAIDQFLQAAGLGSIEHESIESISEYGGTVRIQTSWSARGCAMSSEYEFPSALIDAEDPLQAAREWAAQQKLEEAQEQLRRAQYDLERARRAIEEAQAAVDAAKAAAASA